MLKNKRHSEGGFTFVEIVIIAPIVILMIGAFIAVVVGMTGQVLASRAANVLTYNVQDALNRIESDVKLSTTFLAQNSVIVNSPSTPGDLQPGQGSDDGTASFTNVDGSGNASLILNELATTGSPLDSGSQVAYLSNQPNACGSLQGQNTPLSYNVVYYIKTVNGVSSLWRRVIMPGNYATSACNAIGSSSPGIAVPWQQPSCTPGYNATTDPICATNDVDLVDGVAPGSFNIDYYQTSSSTAADSGAVTGSDPKARGNALVADTTINASIDAIQQVAGRSVEQAASMRVTRLDTNASVVAAATVPVPPSTPVVTGSYTAPLSAVFTWPVPTGGGTMSYSAEYQIGSGSWQTALSSATFAPGVTPSYTVTVGYNNQVVNFRVRATNTSGSAGGTSSDGTDTVTIPLWVTAKMNNTWTDYASPYSTAAYTKTSDGMIMLKGLIRGGTATAGVAILQLPVGYRPSDQMMFQTSSNGTARIDIDASGNVLFETGVNGWLSLDGLNFMPSGYTFTTFSPLQNSWTAYGSPFVQPGYYVDASGRTHLRGVVKGGTVTDGTPIATLPMSLAMPPNPTTSLVPSYYEHISEDNGNAQGFIGINSSDATHTPNTVEAKGGGNGYLSMNALYYPAPSAGYTPPSYSTLPLSGAWTTYGSPYAIPRYIKSDDGVVMLTGLIKGGAVTAQAPIATLPAGYCPSQEIVLTTVANGAWGRVDIMPASSPTSGCTVVVGQASSASAAWTSLDDLSWMAEL